MAYRDASGKITIDEVAAQKDVQRLRSAADKVRASIAAIKSMNSNTERFQGQTYRAVLDKNQEMLARLTALSVKLDESACFIEKTVRYYQKVDEELKKTVLNSAVAGIPAGSSAAQAGKKAYDTVVQGIKNILK